jgi:NAD(P)-dependent dehydrogenase (short-subunit alcohol dehydrogenase family)
MGKATADLLAARGGRVIRCDLREGDVVADLADRAARARLVEDVVRLAGEAIDGLVLCAGISDFVPKAVSINYFGVIDLLDALRPLLARSKAPRAAVVSSLSSAFEANQDIVQACLAGDEEKAVAAVRDGDPMIYISVKRALQLACRHRAVRPEWAGSGILLNLVAPGMIDTPMMNERLNDPQIFPALKAMMPLATNRYGTPEEVAEVLAFLVSRENSLMVGQQIFLDCGSDAVLRADHI